MIRNGINELGQENFCKRINLDYESALGGSEQEKDICSKLLFTAYQGTENSSYEHFSIRLNTWPILLELPFLAGL